jgi:hypothetical protein
MRLKYLGPFDAVEIPELGLTVERDEIIDVDDAIGKRLALSADWQVTSRKKGEE